MSDTVGTGVIELSVGSSGVESGLERVDSSIVRTGRRLVDLGTAGTTALDGIAASSNTSAARVDNATRNLVGSVERATAALESGKKSGADYFETLARSRGANLDVLAPYIAQLREVEAAQARAASAVEATRAAQLAAAETARIEAAAQREAVQALAGREAFLNGLREQISLFGRSADQTLAYRAALAGVSTEAAPLIAQLQSLRTAHEQVATAARAEADAQRQAVQVQAGRDQFVTGLQQQAEAIGRTRAELLELRAAQLGVSNEAAPFIARIRESEQGLTRTGVSAAQTAAALRGVPAQFTDIVTSLQGGQRPLSVFLQQGGQLRDMFGSAGGAARALGGYVVGLINPFTVAAAAGVALTLAYQQGSAEADAYRRSLILTGNAAGTTTSQLTGMAQAISKQVGTQGEAAAALAALAGTGKVGAENLQQFGATAVRAQESLGIAVKDTVAEFAELGKSPLQASEKLNEKYRYLTLSVYEQIKALEQQGRTDDAAKVAQAAYAEAVDSRAKGVKDSLGTLEKGWKAVGDTAKSAWDYMLNVGREDTFEQKLTKAQDVLAKAQAARYTFVGGGADGKADLDNAQAKVDALKKEEDAGRRVAVIDAERIRLQEAGIAWDKEGDKYLTRRQQLERDILATRNEGLAAGASDAEIAKRQGEIRKSYADIFNAGIDSQIEGVKRRGAAEDEIANRSRTLLEANKAAGIVNEQDYLRAVEQLDEVDFNKKRDRLQQELRLVAGKANSEKEQAALSAQISLTAEQILSRRIKLQQDLNTLDINNTRTASGNYADLVSKQGDVVTSLKQQALAQRDANDQIGMNAVGIAELTAARLEELAVQKDQAAVTAEGLDITGALAEKYRDEATALRDLASAKRDGAFKEVAQKAADDAATAGKRMAEQIEGSLTDALMRGFESGKSFAENLRDTTINMFKTMVLKPTIQGVVSGGINGITGGNNANSTTSALQAASGLGSLYNTFAGLGGTVSSLGNLFGSSAISAFGSGLANGAAATEAIAAYNAVGLTSVASSMSAGAGLSTGITTAIAAIPGWGWAALGAAAIGAYLLNDGPEQNTHLTFANNNTPGNISINERGNEGKNASYIDNFGTSALGTFGVSNSFWMSSSSDVVQSFIKTVSATDDALSTFLTSAERASVSTYLTGKTYTAQTGAEGSNPNATGQLEKVLSDRINNILEGVEPGLSSLESGFSGTAQQMATEVAALLQFRSALKDGGEAVFGAAVTLQQIAALKAPTESTSAALARITQEFSATNQVASILGKDVSTAFGVAGLASESARAQIILLSGGLSTFTSQASSFAQNYLTQAERLEPVSKQLDAALASLGLSTIPATKDQFKALVKGLDLSSEGGQKMYASLMGLQDAFAQVHAEADATVAAVRSATDIASERTDLQKRLDQATLTSAQLEDQRRAAIDGSNLALYGQVLAAEAAKAATDAQAEAMKAVAEAQAQAAAAQVQAAASAAAALKQTNTGYQQQIDQLLAAREGESAVRALETAGMDASTVALYDRLAALKAEDVQVAANAKSIAEQAAAAIKADEEMRAAAAKADEDMRANAAANWKNAEQARQQIEQAAAQAAEQLATQRADKELTLYNLTHSASEQLVHQRELELAAMDATLRPIQQLIYAQQDMAAAAGIAAQAIQDAAAKAASIASEGAGINRDMLQLRGDTAGLRALELAALDPANRAAKQAYYDLQDKMASDQAMAQAAAAIAQAQQAAAEESKRAAEALKAAWQSTTDSITDEIKRLRGLVAGNSPQSLSEAQSAFAIATTQARAGDQDAAKSLPALERAMLTLAEAQAVTEFDLRLVRAQAAASLSLTAGVLASQFHLNVPSYDVGTNYVPGTGLALVHEGEKIIPAAYNNPFTPPAVASVGSNGDLIAELREARAQWAAMRQELNAALYAIAKYTGEAAGYLDGAVNGGVPIKVDQIALEPA